MPELVPKTNHYCFTNRFGKKYFIRQIRGRNSKRFVATISPSKALVRIPDGYEVREGINGHISVCRLRPRSISIQEEHLVRTTLLKIRSNAYQATIRDRAITIFASANDWKTYTETLDAEFSEGFAAAIEETLSRKYGRELANLFRVRRKERDGVKKPLRYYPLLQFELADPNSREFKVKRIYFTGDQDWLVLETLPLSTAILRYIPHLGRNSFFDLL